MRKISQKDFEYLDKIQQMVLDNSKTKRRIKMMNITQSYEPDSSKPYIASMKWETPWGSHATTCGSSDHSYAEAIGNMIIQLSATKDYNLTLNFINDEGQITTQKKM